MTTEQTQIHRLLDANLNRAVEGLRVLEECARMLLNDSTLTGRIKDLRHRTAAVIRDNPALDRELLFARDTSADVLSTGASPSELTRTDIISLLRANAKRAAEAVRALEEYGKFISAGLSVAYKDIRFAVYAVEQDIVAALTRVELLAPERLRLGLSIDCARFSECPDTSLDALRQADAGLIVLHAGSLSDRKFSECGRQIMESIDRAAATVLVRDRSDMAHALGADGVLLGADALLPVDCRAILGPGRIIGGECTGHETGPLADLIVTQPDVCPVGETAADQMKPRIVTGVNTVEELRMLPSDVYDGALLELTDPILHQCSEARTIVESWNPPSSGQK